MAIFSSYSKWNMHTSELSRECSSRLYFLRQFKRSGVAPSELVLFYVTCIRPVLEYASPAFHRSLPNYISEDLERIQRRALKIIYPDLSYRVALWKQLAYRNFMRGEKGSSPKGRVVNTHWDAKETSLSPNVAWVSGFSFSRGRGRKQPAKKSLTQGSLL